MICNRASLPKINQRFLGQTIPVLIEDFHNGKWRGRTPQNKLVFFEAQGDWRGRVVDLEITWTGPWSMQGRLPKTEQDESPIVVMMN
jgi:tRNA-2-methylthio-N6-dimethylallyladenosine synthase